MVLTVEAEVAEAQKRQEEIDSLKAEVQELQGEKFQLDSWKERVTNISGEKATLEVVFGELKRKAQDKDDKAAEEARVRQEKI